jgi:UDP-3-O-[3-hydroxymyristoyl] glucosamine N-acyltransferase
MGRARTGIRAETKAAFDLSGGATTFRVMPNLGDIAKLLSLPAPPAAHAALPITGIALLPEAGPGDLSVVGTDAYARQAPASKAAAFVVARRVKLPPGFDRPALLVDDADLAMAGILQLFAPPVPRPPAGIDPAARVAASARLGDGAAVGFNAYVGERVRLGSRTVLHPGVYVGDDTVIGEDCVLFPNVVVRERIRLGNRVIIHAGSMVGSDGFGYRWDGKRHAKIPQIGTVVIEDDVEIGSCVCVDRAKLGATTLGRGTKIDNLVQVAHNVRTGPHCIVVGQAGMAGSVTLGTGVVLGGQVAVRDHVSMSDGSMAAGKAGVADDVPPGQVVSGMPAIPHRQSLREMAALRRLPDLVVQVRKMHEEIEALRKQLEGR